MAGMKRGLLCGAALLAAVPFQAAAAAEPEPGTDIIVTAERREGRLIDTPISLSAFTSADLENRDVTRLEDLAGFVPGLFIEEGSLRTQTLAIRGLSADLNNPGLDQSVGIYVDGVYLGRATPGNAALFDLERIEVLRGPQGALYGKNTIAGAVNYITRLPGDELRGRVELGYGNYDSIRVRGAVSGPLGRGVSASVAGALDKRDGFAENTMTGTREDDIDSLAVRGALRFQPADSFEVVLRGDYSRDRTHAGALDILDNGAFAETPLADADPWDRKIAKDQDTVQDRDVWGVSGEIKWGVGNGELVSLTAYRGFKWSNIADNDYTVLDMLASGIHEDQTQFSQEFRYGGTAGALTYVAGLYYFHQSLDTEARSRIGPGFEIYPEQVTASIFGNVDTDSFAAFAHGDYAFSDTLSVTAGLRYTYEKKLLVHSQAGDPWEVLLPTTAPRNIRRSEDDFSPTLSLNYKPADDMLLYARYARGFKSGGFNVFSVTSTDDARYDPEHVDSFELGFKAGLPGVKGWLAVDLFHMNYANLQVNQLVLVGELPQFVTSNAAKARSQGLEAEFHLQPIDGLDLAATYSYLNAKFTDYSNANTSGDDYTGNRLPYAPRHSASLSAQYVTPLSGNIDLFLRGEASVRSRIHFEADNLYSQAGLALFNARIGVQDSEAGWGLHAWMRNIGNRDHVVNRTGGAIVPGQVIQALGAPRTFGIQASFDF